MILFLTIIFFIFGLIIGSFLNVVICRMNSGRSLGGRSACMSCGNQLCWYELLPLFSFVALKGRCRSCKTKISIQYPLVELATGLIFGVLFLKFQDIFFLNNSNFAIIYVYHALQFSILIVIAAYDLKHKIIPDILAFTFGALAFAGLFFFYSGDFLGFSGLTPFYPHIPSAQEFFSGVFIALPFALLWFISRGAWMGFGDAKLALGLGWFLGFSKALSAVVIAFWAGAIIGVCLILLSKNYGMKSEIPFALYLVFGTLSVFLFDLRIFVL